MRFTILLLLLLPGALAATISGNVYDLDFVPLKNVVVSIDTIPKQTFVATDGAYSFQVPLGDYTLTASLATSDGLTPYAKEDVLVQDDGEYTMDLFTFPQLEASEDLDVLDIENQSALDYPEVSKTPLWPWILMIAILIAAIVYILLRQTKAVDRALPEDLQEMVALIRAQGGRTTQKELRKHMPLSEAKISLMVTDLEERGYLAKVKKGRGNILLLKK